MTRTLVGEIESYGIHRPPLRRFWAWFFLAGIILAAIGFIFLWPPNLAGANGAQVATAFVAALVLLFGYHQWRGVRHEISIDKEAAEKVA